MTGANAQPVNTQRANGANGAKAQRHSAGEPGPAMIKLSDSDRTILDEEADIRGRQVVDADGNELGKVADLLIDDEGRAVRFLVVAHGGILGIGATQSFIPVEAIAHIDADRVTVNTDLKTVAAAPQYDPEIGDDAGYYSDVYGYYGVAPFWTSGLVAPDFVIFDPRDQKQ